MSDETGRTEQYSHGYSAAAERMAQRPVAPNIAFFLPHLRPGMRLLDCGCGPGTNTVALAEVIAPGAAVGIDLNERQVAAATAYAAQSGAAHVRFEAGSVYALPFPDASFDAAFAHMVLQHLKEPAEALAEMFRVLKPGGLIGVRESDEASGIHAPLEPSLQQLAQLYYRLWQHNGGDPFIGRSLPRLLREAGFTDIVSTAGTECHGRAERTPDGRHAESAQYWSDYVARAILEPNIADRIIALGWADRPALEQMAAAMMAWGKHPDAFYAVICCEAVGRKE